jgi:hypothetical protein
MKLSGLKAKASIRILAESAEAENLLVQRQIPLRVAHSSPLLKGWVFCEGG